MLIAAGTAAVGKFLPDENVRCSHNIPMRHRHRQRPTRAARRNLPSVFNIAHWLRDGRLTFKTNSVVISSSPCDSFQGSQPILADNVNYELIIVGKRYVRMLCSLLHDAATGRNEDSDFGWTTYAGREREFGTTPRQSQDVASDRHGLCRAALRTFSRRYLQHDGNPLAELRCTAPFYSYFFDSQTPYVNPGANSWNIDTYGIGLNSVPIR